MDIFLTEIQVFEITGFTKTQLFEMIEAGDFPKPIETERANRWIESEIFQWLNSKNLHISR
jgi:predicted DNA-binding transcriptional regulator AlpA